MRNYPSSLDEPASRKLGTFSYLPEMDEARTRGLIDYLIARGWTPGVEHVEPLRAGDDFWYMWKLPFFGEKSAERVLAEIEDCKQAFPHHLVRVLGYDNAKQTQGTCAVVHRPEPGAGRLGRR